nr:RNA-directed DNA polymerase, eukaryota, reverse transcriptase zinc-binding domain protein [Tanacetum cinerariifolium]
MITEVSNKEIKEAIFDIDDNKAPGPNGFTAKFFKKSWNVIGDDVCKAVNEFFSKGKLLGELNATLITLVPKSTIFYGSMDRSTIDSILQILPSKRGKLPVRYLGVPLVSKKIGVKDCKGLIDKVKSRIQDWKNKILSYAERTQLIASVLSSIQVYWASMFKLPKLVTNDIEKLFKGFLWNSELQRGKAKVAWKERTNNGNFKAFSCNQDLKVLRTLNDKVQWWKVIWFSQNIPRQAFVLWMAMKKKLVTQDKLALWYPGKVWKCPYYMEHYEKIAHCKYCLSYMARKELKSVSTENRSPEVLYQIIMDNVKCRLLSLKVKNSKAVKAVEELWKINMNKINFAELGSMLIITVDGLVSWTFYGFLFLIDSYDPSVGLRSTWKAHPAGNPNNVWSLDIVLQDPQHVIWARLHKESLNSRKNILKAELADLDGVIDKGEGSYADGHRRREVVRLIQEVEKNADLEREVSNEEIKRAIWDCVIDKAPEPDGFTFGFYRRPISLIGSLYKVTAKVLANRLVTVLDDIVDEIQSAFVTDRQILDGHFILNEIVHWCKNKKKQSVIFKVDFEKAYDSVRRDFIDDILRRFGFGEKWCTWIQSCLYSSRGSVLVNGSPTKEFQFHKGLFNGIKLDSSLQISHLFYADDAIFMAQ